MTAKAFAYGSTGSQHASTAKQHESTAHRAADREDADTAVSSSSRAMSLGLADSPSRSVTHVVANRSRYCGVCTAFTAGMIFSSRYPTDSVR